MRTKADFREFVFTASGGAVDHPEISKVDLYDNLIVEADRLKTIAGLVGCSSDALEPDSLVGLGLLLGDIQRRMRTILDLALEMKGEGHVSKRPSKRGKRD